MNNKMYSETFLEAANDILEIASKYLQKETLLITNLTDEQIIILKVLDNAKIGIKENTVMPIEETY